jgi:hypothetical protein
VASFRPDESWLIHLEVPCVKDLLSCGSPSRIDLNRCTMLTRALSAPLLSCCAWLGAPCRAPQSAIPIAGVDRLGTCQQPKQKHSEKSDKGFRRSLRSSRHRRHGRLLVATTSVGEVPAQLYESVDLPGAWQKFDMKGTAFPTVGGEKCDLIKEPETKYLRGACEANFGNISHTHVSSRTIRTRAP